jgi:hypothetical protein
MDIFNEDSKNAISQAYDNLKRDEFLNRLNTYIQEVIELTWDYAQIKGKPEALSQKLFDGVKTKPGPRAKREDFPIEFNQDK